VIYLSHFGLREPPFGITPDTSFFYSCASSQEALNTLLVAVANGEGFIKITGEVGTGKTLLCRKFLATLDDNWVSGLCAQPRPRAQDPAPRVAEELGVKLDSGLRPATTCSRVSTSRCSTLRARRSAWSCAWTRHRRCRSNRSKPATPLPTSRPRSAKLVQVILFGQPELDERLAHASIRQLRQRITFQHHMGTLTRDETEHYLDYRLAIAGYSGDAVFAKAAAKAIYRASRGVPRLINILANKALMLTYGEGTRKVTARHAREASVDTPASFGFSRAWLWLALACMAFSSAGWVILR